MSVLVTAKEMKELDRKTIYEKGVPSMVLMERAALASVEELMSSKFDLSKVICVCGAGNNGGDGIAVSRLLFLKSIDAEIIFVGNKKRMSEETKMQMSIAENYGVKIHYDSQVLSKLNPTTIVDGLFGIGLARDLEGEFRQIVELINESDADVISLDIPSGLSADTGEILGVSVKAQKTVTFAFNKIGLAKEIARGYTGEVVVKDIGIYR